MKLNVPSIFFFVEKKSFESFSFLKALGEEDLSSAGQSNEELPKENIFFFFKTKKNDS
jgi:hypothetical protein